MFDECPLICSLNAHTLIISAIIPIWMYQCCVVVFLVSVLCEALFFHRDYVLFVKMLLHSMVGVDIVLLLFAGVRSCKRS